MDFERTKIEIISEIAAESKLTNALYLNGNLTVDPFYKELGKNNYLTKFIITVGEKKTNRKTGGTYIQRDTFTANFFGESFYNYTKVNGATKGMKIKVVGKFSINVQVLSNGLKRHHANVEGLELWLEDAETIMQIVPDELEPIEAEISPPEDQEQEDVETKERVKELIRRHKKSSKEDRDENKR